MEEKEMLGEYISQTQEERNYHVLRSWFPRWVWNTASNFLKIKAEFDEGKQYSLADHKKTHHGPAVIAGAGPSFDRAAPYLKDWKGPVFVSESMAKTCLGWGRQPEYVGLFDSGMQHGFFEDVNWKGSTLLTHPAVNPRVLRLWKWDKIYYVMMHHSEVDYQMLEKNKGLITLNEVIEIIKDQTFGSDFFEHINPILFPFVKAMILNAGCVVNNMMQCAHFMGYDPLFLVGVDFSYPSGVQGARKWITPKRYPLEPFFIWRRRWHLRDSPPVETILPGRKWHNTENGIPTTEEQIEYKIAFLSVYKIDKPQVFDCSEGALTELVKKDFREVVERDGKGYEKEFRSGEEIERICDDYYHRQEKLPLERDVNRKGEEVRPEAGQ